MMTTMRLRDGICLLAYTKTKTDKRSTNMNRKKITASKQTQLMALAIIATSVVAAAMIIGINNSQKESKPLFSAYSLLLLSLTDTTAACRSN
jgi:hypothetical protein